MIFFRIAGIFLIVMPIVFLFAFFSLRHTFEYPSILRKPTDYILERFAQGGSHLIAFWYVFFMSAVLIIPMTLFFQLVFVEQHRYLATSSAVVGALSGLVQTVGLLHWVFLVPSLANQYNADTSTSATHESVAVVFQAFHCYASVAVREHLGSLLTGVWTILISSMMFSTPIFGTPLAIVGIISALGILVGLFEPTGWKPARAINAVGYIVWSVWLLISGVILILA
ncbi:MAG: DUF4386 domain-containing protein [Anaerolineae bacterium]|nr:DUF4386 domain-containing protein [Anaerolineae bacterium]